MRFQIDLKTQLFKFCLGTGMMIAPMAVCAQSYIGHTILANLISNNSTNTDIYVGLKIPLYKIISY